MVTPDDTSTSTGYGAQFGVTIWQSFARLMRRPQPSATTGGTRRLWRQLLLLDGIGLIVILLVMVGFDATEIGLMPPRGSPGLWWARILTDFGKDAYVLEILAALMIVVAIAAPRWPQASRGRLLHFGTHVQFLFLAVLVPVLCTQVLKWVIGRGRPFVGGKADVLNFHPFTGAEPYFSLPSGHAVASVALAFAVATVWPRATVLMALYAAVIVLSRLVLLAHHPSDVLAGALVGISGAMVVRHWFAVRRLGFSVSGEGRIIPH
jgi:membrane-associated phospholipid phosphatase